MQGIGVTRIEWRDAVQRGAWYTGEGCRIWGGARMKGVVQTTEGCRV